MSPFGRRAASRRALRGCAVNGGREADAVAIFHMNISVVGRRDGASSVAGAAYISRSSIYDERVGLTRDYRRCHRHERLVADLGVTLPDGAPERWRDRGTLWNEVERAESSPRAQLCRRIEVALPVELDEAQRFELARGIVGYFVDQGMVVDACIHDALDGHNPHLHMLMPLRPCDGDGFLPKSINEYLVRDGGGTEQWMGAAELREVSSAGGAWAKVFRWRRGKEMLELTADEAEVMGGCKRTGKAPVQRTRYLVDWNERSKAEEWRAAVAAMVNGALGAAGRPERVDHRSYARQGVERVPTLHEGPAAFAIERRARRRQERERRPRRYATARRIANRFATRSEELLLLLIQILIYHMEERERERERRHRRSDTRGRRAQPTRGVSRGRAAGRQR